MKNYKMVVLNEDAHLSIKKDIEDAEKTLNEYAMQGWELEQIVKLADISDHMVAVMSREY